MAEGNRCSLVQDVEVLRGEAPVDSETEASLPVRASVGFCGGQPEGPSAVSPGDQSGQGDQGRMCKYGDVNRAFTHGAQMYASSIVTDKILFRRVYRFT